MTTDEEAKILLEMLVTAMLITLQRQQENGEPSTPGLVGGPPAKGEESTEPRGFGRVLALNKMTDLVMRSLQAATRYRMAIELDMLYAEDNTDDLSMIRLDTFGITFNMKFKKTISNEQLKKIELAADVVQPYFHYRLFEKNPTVSEFLESLEWKDGIESDPDLDENERETALAFFEQAMPEVVQMLHVNHDSIKEHSSRIFNKSLAHLHELLASDGDGLKPGFDAIVGIKPISLSDILRMNLH